MSEQTTVESCDLCGLTAQEHDAYHASSTVDIMMMAQAHKMLPPEYAKVLNAIMQDWRTHALPECHPWAIK